MRRLAAMMTAAAALAASSATVIACGDKLSAMAGGVRFERLHQARNPSRLVVYLPASSGLREAESELQLVRLLTRAGHTVRVVERRAELEQILAASDADLVLAGADDLLDLGRNAAATPTATARRPAVLPLDYSASGAGRVAAAADAGSCVTRVSRRSGGQLVRTIDSALQRRSDGTTLPCG
jgi:hypothetical protein